MHRKDTLTYNDMLPTVLANQFGVFLPSVLSLPLLGCSRGLRIDDGTPPTVHVLLFEALGLLVFYEIGFYYGHLLMHHPRVYARVHKNTI